MTDGMTRDEREPLTIQNPEHARQSAEIFARAARGPSLTCTRSWLNAVAQLLEYMARSTSTEPQDGWQPMSSAPKDGTEIVVGTNELVQVIAHYQPGGFCIEDHPAIEEGWYFWTGSMFSTLRNARVWRPLPPALARTSPPAERTEQEEPNDKR